MLGVVTFIKYMKNRDNNMISDEILILFCIVYMVFIRMY
jgi:hypothetical protein